MANETRPNARHTPAERFHDFAKRHGLELRIKVRTTPALPSHYAFFDGVEVLRDGVVTFGNGDSPKSATRDYAKRIAGTRIVVNAHSDDRREIDVPSELTFDDAPTPTEVLEAIHWLRRQTPLCTELRFLLHTQSDDAACERAIVELYRRSRDA